MFSACMMLTKKPRGSFGFTMGEVLLAILFISIAFFGYAALHQRIILSSWKTELRTQPREAARTQLISGMNSIRQGQTVLDSSQTTSTSTPAQDVNTGLYKVGATEKWTDLSKRQANSQETYTFSTLVTARRNATW